MLSEGFSPDIYSPPYYQVISKIPYVFISLLNPNILHLKALIGLLKHHHLNFLPDCYHFI